MSRVLLGVLGVAVLGVSASARIPRHNRPPAQVQVSLSERTKPYQPAPASTARPEITAEEVLSLGGLSGPIRMEQERILLDLVANTSDSEVEEKADYMFRLGELYAKQQRSWRLKSIQHQRANQTADATAAANKAKDYLLKTVRTYKSLADNNRYRNYPKLDTALFYYAYTLQSGKYLKEARAVYDKLLKNYPNSKYVPEAHLAFADYYDESGQLVDAEARYKMVLKFPKAAVYWYAQYRLGWISFQLARYQEALEAFYLAAQGSKQDPAMSRAAKRDFVRAYAEIGKADKAYAAFQRVDAAMALDMLHHLATIYLERGKYDHAVFVHRDLVSRAPGDPRACAWQYTAARGMLSHAGASNTDKVAEIEKLVTLQVSLAPKLSAADADECRANAAALSSELGRAWHSEGTKTLNNDTFVLAVRLYRAFLDGFPKDPSTPEIRFLHADALWATAVGERNDRIQADRFEQAGDAFAEVAVTDPQRALDAAYASVLARLNALDDVAPRSADAEVARRTPPTPIAMPVRGQKLVDAIALYASVQKDPKSDHLGAMRFAEANLYRRYEHHDQAAPLYVGLVTSHRTAPFAESAAMLALDSLIVTQRIDELLKLADKLAADSAFLANKPELEKLVKYVRTRSMRR